jgi:hypothetical protein
MVPMAIGANRVTGLLVKLEPEEFSKLLDRAKDLLVVMVESGVFSTHYDYLTSYKGLPFYTRSKDPLKLPAGAEVVNASSILLPD